MTGSRSSPMLFGHSFAVTQSLRALATISHVYSEMPNATAALNIVSHGPLWEAQWCSNKGEANESGSQDLLPYTLSRSETFACIAMLESGSFNLNPNDLSDVMALSAGDSIYVAAPILCDPATQRRPHEITRIIGNLGRPGLAFLIAPRNPRIRGI